MRRIESLDRIKTPFTKAVVTIGNFDGVHKGHQSLFKIVRHRAEQIQGTSVVVTFEPHPLRVLTTTTTPPLITPFEQKMELIAATGVDACVCIPFTRAFADISARDFVANFLLARLGMTVMVVGEDYAFGKNREGDINYLKNAADMFDFDLICLEKITSSGKNSKISSTVIRDLVSRGDMAAAYQMLGRYYQIRGEVVSGRGRGGKALGFPTANIRLVDELCPLAGVYAVIVTYQSKKHRGVANIGYSPTFDDHIFTVEVHILNFDQTINGHQIRIDFIKRLRDEKKFNNLEDLKQQIAKDSKTAEKLLTDLIADGRNEVSHDVA